MGRFGYFGCMAFSSGEISHAELLPRRTIELTLKCVSIVTGSSLPHRVYRRLELELELLYFQVGSRGIAAEMTSSWNTPSSRPSEYTIVKCSGQIGRLGGRWWNEIKIRQLNPDVKNRLETHH